MDISNEILSYIIGFLHADGHLYETTRNRGKISIELADRDKDILIKINNVFYKRGHITNRTRNTNYKKNYKSTILTICHKDIRDYLKSHGLIAGKKSYKVDIPENISKKNYMRGYLDGNGSLGFTSAGFPFLSITTASTFLKESICDFIYRITGKQKNINPNKRDNIYNIIVNREDAQKVASHLYKDSQIYLNRKYQSYLEIMKWKRPKNITVRKNTKPWFKKEDLYIITHPLSMSMEKLSRSKSSIKTRLWRLRRKQGKTTLDEAPGAYKDSKVIEGAIEPTAVIVDKIKPVHNMKDGGQSFRKKGKHA
jgi:hypothetical protein